MNFLIAFILTQCLQLDITLVGDISGSVDGNRHHVVEAFDGLIDRFENKDVRISIIAFGNYPYVLANYSYDNQYLKEQSKRILDLDLGASTDLTEALMMAAANSFAGREGVRKVIVIVSDGHPTMKRRPILQPWR